MTADEHFFLVSEDRAFAWLKDPDLQTLFSLLNQSGEEVRVVGGAVRNSLMGLPVSDIDCATTADPSLVMDLARAAKVRVLPTGLDHGTVTVLIGEHAFEVTTLRTDEKTDGRRATVSFGKSWREDAQRRDFTMNALYLDRNGRLYDPVGRGVADAKMRSVQFIGDASKRISEDYLRVLRFFRFYAHYGQHFCQEDYVACIEAQGALKGLSGERVGAEMRKLVVGGYAGDALALMHSGGMLTAILGGVPRLTRCARLRAVTEAIRYAPSEALLLTCLCVETPEDAARLAKKLRLPNRLRDAMAKLCDRVRTIQSISEEELQRLAYIYGKDLACDLVIFALVRRQIVPDLTELSMMLHNLALWQLPVFPLNGRDLLDRGIPAGPKLGDQLSKLEQTWVDSGFVLSKSQLLSRRLTTC